MSKEELEILLTKAIRIIAIKENKDYEQVLKELKGGE